MLNLISLPVCEIAEAPARFVALASSTHVAAWIAGLLLLAGVIFSTVRRTRRLLGQAMLFAAVSFGTLPIMSLLLAGFADCANPELLARLSRVLPVLSMLAIGILVASAVGALLLLYRLLESLHAMRGSDEASRHRALG